jgi:hypothetical protein
MNCKASLLLLGLAVALSFCSCSQTTDYGEKTFPVTGTVYVDGQPAAQLSITLHEVGGGDADIASVSTAMTNEDGTFAVSTFEAEDGVPEGDYVMTFQWGKFNAIAAQFEGDKLNGKYADPKASDIKVTVSEGEPTDMGRIDLIKK